MQMMHQSDDTLKPGSYFPSSENSDMYAKRLAGYDIYKSSKMWIAVVAVEDPYGEISIKLYRWRKRRFVPGWKNVLCNMRIDYLDFELISKRVERLREQFHVSDNQKEADRIRRKLGVSDEPAKPDIEKRFPHWKYSQYAGFDGDFSHCVGSE